MYVNEKERYEVGKEYILVLECIDSLFLEKPRYMFCGGLYLPVDDMSACSSYGKALDGDIAATLETCIAEKKALAAQATEMTSDVLFTHSEQMEDILDITRNVAIVHVKEKMLDGRDMELSAYYCTPVEILKGETFNCNGSGYIIVTTEKDGLTPGEDYLVLVNQVDEHSFIYTITSLDSVIPVTDTSRMERVREAIVLE